jgi:MFS family permease
MKIVETQHHRWILFTSCFAIFVWRLDLYTVSISLPTISRHFGVGTDTASFVVISYSLFLSSSLLIVGRIEDVVGPIRVLGWGFLIFALGGLCSCLSPSISVVILARSVQGVAGAIIISSVYAMVSGLLPMHARGGAFGLVSACAALGIAVGTPLGGAISGWISWRGVFLLAVGLGLVGAALAFKTIPSVGNKHKDLRSSLDVSGAILSFLSLFLVLLALNRMSQFGWNSPVIIGILMASAIPGILFVYREKRSIAPLVSLSLIGNTRSICAFLVGVLTLGALSGNALLMPFYLEMIKGLTPQSSGTAFLIYSLTFAVTAFIVGRVAENVHPRLLVTAALLTGIGACLYFVVTLGNQGNVGYLAFLFLLGLSVGLFLPPNNYALMNRAPEGAKGAFSSLYNIFNNLGWAIGACLSEAVFSRYVHSVPGVNSHRGISREILVMGFEHAYMVIGALLFGALILSVILLSHGAPPKAIMAYDRHVKESEKPTGKGLNEVQSHF